MIHPRPTAMRLVTCARGARTPVPLFGLGAWSDDASAVGILVDATQIDAEDPALVAAQIPAAEDLPPRTQVFILGGAARGAGLARWFWPRAVSVPRAARCAALVARGYVAVGAGIDDTSGTDVAWGLSSLY
ncbi:MAG: hypothetical protein M3O46_11455 [Myxococcota bacterium]|nr:hypothetical protein [Myxococcota bacterium]